MGLRNILHYLLLITAYTLWFTALVAIGSVIGDIDHIIGEARTWGHNPVILLGVCLAGLVITHLCRQIGARILRR